MPSAISAVNLKIIAYPIWSKSKVRYRRTDRVHRRKA